MDVQLVRHATLLVNLGGKTLLVDPMLGDKGKMPPIANSSNDRRNPLVELMAPTDYLRKVDGVLVTHTHKDHFDEAAVEKLSKKIPLFCQPEDRKKLIGEGFENVIPVEKEIMWEGIQVFRTGGQHGTGEIGKRMAPVSGFVLKAIGEPSLYVAGDTIYCTEVETALANHQPDFAVVNGGGARFKVGDPITMTPADVEKVLRFSPDTRVVVVHLDAINHCLITREEFHNYFNQESVRLLIPADGEILSFPAV